MTKALKSARAIVVDWGTTSFRAALLDEFGVAIDEIETESGIQFVSDGAFEVVLFEAIRRWLSENGRLPVIALGMITSRNGWVEVPYVPCPATVNDLARGVVHRKLANGSDLVFLPGITDPARRPYPDVMRGEETQIVGYGLADEAVVVMPGTHSKWATVSGGKIQGFQSFVTGEIYALLSQHSFIAKAATQVNEAPDWDAFDRGVNVAELANAADAAFLSQVFSARTGMLANQLRPEEFQDYISGILIGSEFRQARDGGWFKTGDTIGIVGNDGLNARYSRVAGLFGLNTADGGEQAANTGALRIYDALRETSKAPT